MPTAVDPFTQVYNQILKVFKEDTTLSGLVRTGNLIEFTTPNPVKNNIQPGDAPEVMIEPISGIDQFASTSTSAKSTVTWSIKCATNNLQLFFNNLQGNPTGLFPLKWAIIVAFDAAGDNLKVNDQGLSFLRSTRITASMKSPFDPAGNPVSESRGTDGWTLLATLITELDLPRDDAGRLITPTS